MNPLTDAERAALADRVAALPDGAPARKAWAEGTYGLCVSCGDGIAAAALAERPELAHCAACTDARHRANQARRFGICGVRP